jgi:hypothetical protein
MDHNDDVLPSLPEEDLPVEVLHIATTTLGQYVKFISALNTNLLPPHQVIVKGFPFRVKLINYNWQDTYTVTFTDDQRRVMAHWAKVQIVYLPTSKDPNKRLQPILVRI